MPTVACAEAAPGPDAEQPRARERWRAWVRRPWVTSPYLILSVMLAAVMWPAWILQDQLVSRGDAMAIHYPWFVLWRNLLAADEWPFWNPYSFTGIPAFATLQAGYGYPLHWLLTPLPPLTAMNWLIGLHVLLAGLGTAWCAGRLGATREGQVLSGLAYALGSAMVARIWAGHFSFLEANAWLPLATGLVLQVGSRHGVTRLALAVGMMTLAGQPEIVIFSLWWLPLWALAGSLRVQGERPIRSVLRTGVGVTLGIGLAAFQLVPVLSVLAISNRQVGMSWDFQTGASLPPWHLLGAVAPLAFGDPNGSYWPGPGYEWHERLLFVGVVPLLAAGCVSGRWRWVCWGAALVALGLAAGRYAPWFGWAQWLPGYATLRIPSKHLALVALALALAAGVGLPRLAGRRVAGALAGLAVLLLAFGAVTASMLMDALLPPITDPSVLLRGGLWPAILVTIGAAALALVPHTRARHAAFVALALCELTLVLDPFRNVRSDPTAVVQRASLPDGSARVGTINGDAIVANFGPVLGVQQPGGFVSLFSAEYMELLSGSRNPGVVLSAPRGSDPILNLLGYPVILDREERRVTVYDPPPPRAWVARCTWPGMAREARQPGFPRGECVTSAGSTERQAPVPRGPARIVEERASWWTVEAVGPGWLVLAQPWYPGWRAHINGILLPAEPVDGALVGILLPEGTHRVEVWYRPDGLETGLSVSGAVALVLLWFWWMDRGRAAQAHVRVGR